MKKPRMPDLRQGPNYRLDSELAGYCALAALFAPIVVLIVWFTLIVMGVRIG